MRKLPARSRFLLPLAAWAALCSASDPAAAPGPPDSAAPVFFSSASLRLSLAESRAICEGQFTFTYPGRGPAAFPLPLAPGRLASQTSPSGASLALPAEAPASRDSPLRAWVHLPGPGRHQLQFRLEAPARKTEAFWQACLPHPGAAVCEVSIQPGEGVRLDPASLPRGISNGKTVTLAFCPSQSPLALRWQPAPPVPPPGISLQTSRFDFTLGDGEVRGNLELRAAGHPSPSPRSLRFRIPPGCIVTSVEPVAASSWRVRHGTLFLELPGDSSPEFGLTLRTVSPVLSAETTLELPLPRLELARRVEGILTLRNAGPHHIASFQVPPGFVARNRATPQPSAAAEPAPERAYDFVSCEDGATAELTLCQPRPRVRAKTTTLLSIDEQSAGIVRQILLQAEAAPAFSAAIQLPADETTAAIRLLRGQAEIRRGPAGEVTLHWSRGLSPGQSILLEIATRKPLLWHENTAPLRLEPPRLPDGPGSGSISVQTAAPVQLLPARNPLLDPVPVSSLPPEMCAAWTHEDYDVLRFEIGKRPIHRAASSICRVSASPRGGTMTGELRVDPGGMPMEDFALTLDKGDPRLLRFRSPIVSATGYDPQTRTLRAVLRAPQAEAFTLSWELPLFPSAIQVEGARRRASFEVPLPWTPGIPLQPFRLEFARQPFVTLQFAPHGLAPVPPPAPDGKTGIEAAFLAATPASTLRMTCEEIGVPAQAPWQIESLTLDSQITPNAPHRHRCRIVLEGSPEARVLPLVLPPRATLLSALIQDRPLAPLESPAHSRELLLPLPGSPGRIHLALDYLTDEAFWAISGEATVVPPGLPAQTVTQNCDWTLRLPLEFHCSDFSGNLSLRTLTREPPITVRPFLANAQPPGAARSPILKFQGDFSPSPISFHYVHLQRQVLIALLCALGGAAAFFVFARERPLYLGLFGILLLTFLPQSGLAPLRTVADGLLLGWIGGCLAFTLCRLAQPGHRLLRKPAARLATLLLTGLGAYPSGASSPFPAAPPAQSLASPVALPLPAVLDLHLATTLRKNGASSHLARAWFLPPPERILELELPISSVVTAVRLNGEPAAMRSLSISGAGPPLFAMALPPTLPRDVPSLLEITYHSDPEGSAAPNQRRIPFRLGAPRLGTLPVAQTVWQAGILEGFQLRLDGGNLYPLEPNEFQNERRQSLAGLPPGLPPTLERGDHSAGETPQANRPLSASALFFKKLKGDAQLRLVAVPRPDPAVLNSWLWFGAALATLAGLERIFGRARRSA